MFRFTFLILILGTISCFSQVSSKRGLAYGNHTVKDIQKMTTGISWWYNWYHQPENAVASTYESYGVDYVPMAWNGSFNKEAMRTYLAAHPNVKYLLGWNEPNFVSQANMTPTEAAKKWPDLEAMADEFDLKLVSPAVNYCDVCVSENGTTYADPVKYLDDFFTACADCRVDYIAIHSYMGNVSAFQWFVGLFKKYGKPIWVTEFANWENNPTLEQQKGFMIGAVDYLENDPDVFRYAWFTGRHAGPPYIGVLDQSQSGVLTPLGEIYVNMPLHNADQYTGLPARIEFENYNTMSGILLEATTDVDGFANVGYIEGGDWLEYGIDVPETDVYEFSIRYAGTSASNVQILIDGGLTQTISLPATGGWQTWKTLETTASLLAGKHKIRFKAGSSGFNLNWFRLTNEVILSSEGDQANLISIFPNPTRRTLTINSSLDLTDVAVVDIMGRKSIEQPFCGEIDLSTVASGSYSIRFKTRNGRWIFKRLIKE